MQTEILKLHNDMEKYTLEAGISERKFKSVIIDIDEFTEKEKLELYTWLNDIKRGPYKKIIDIYVFAAEIYGSLSKEIFERYKQHGVSDLREQGILSDARRELRRAWEHPYRTESQKKRLRQHKAATRHKDVT